MSAASHSGERVDGLEVYLGRRVEGTLALAFGPGGSVGRSPAGTALERATSAVLRGGLTGWVHVGMLVRRMRGRADPLVGLGQQDTFTALARLVEAAIEARPLPAEAPGGGQGAPHLRLFTTPVGGDDAMERIGRVLRPYCAASTTSRTGTALIGWFAVKHLIATRSHDYSLQVVHLSGPGGRGGRVSLMLPEDPTEREAVPPSGSPSGSPSASPSGSPGSRSWRRRTSRRASTWAGPEGVPAALAGASTADPSGVHAYLDAYREHLARELLLQPVVVGGTLAEFAWTPEPTADGGVAVAGTLPGAIGNGVVLRMAAHAVAQLGERLPRSAGVPLTEPEPDGDLLVQRWAVGVDGGHVLSVAVRTGDRRRPTQVLIHVAPVRLATTSEHVDGPALPPPPHEPPRTGAEVDDARGLTLIPIWWRSAGARCDGNDVILYEAPFRGRRLRVRANDYPAEAMYTLLVGDPGAEVAALDLERWPSPWVRPQTL